MKHLVSNTSATYKKTIDLKVEGYPIKDYAVQGVYVGEYNTTKKYFTHLLGEDSYKELRDGFFKRIVKKKRIRVKLV